MKLFKKLAQLAHETIPSSKTVYFVYTHRNGYDRFNNGLKANTEISYFIYKALRQTFPHVRFLKLENEKVALVEKIRPQDVVIGHSGDTFLKAAKKTKKLIIFHPWSGHENVGSLLPRHQEIAYYEKAASVIFLTSEYNVRTYLQPGSFWHSFFENKRLRVVHQPIDLTLFKRVKWEYGFSNFLYVGRDAHMKCLPASKELVARLGKKLHIYGCEGKKLSNLDHFLFQRLGKEADFFIQPGMWEAQCVSILEAAARGFIPIVSEETGYPYSHPFLLRYNDLAYNEKVLRNLLETTPEERALLSDTLYSQLCSDINHNNWKKLTDVLVEEVKRLL